MDKQYKMVPTELTHEMEMAMIQAANRSADYSHKDLYAAAIEAAPTQPSPAESDKESVRNAALEEAAKVCDGHAGAIDVTGKEPQSWSVVRGAVLVTGDMIRALKSTSVSEVSQPAQPSDTEGS